MNKVTEIIKEGIDKNGSETYYNLVACNWHNFENQFKEAILSEIKNHIKPNKKIESIDDLAKLLDGNEFYYELQNEYNINVEELCKNNNWVIIFGAGDDLIELEVLLMAKMVHGMVH